MMKISQGIQDIALVSHWPMLPPAAAATAARLPFNAACLPACTTGQAAAGRRRQ